MKTARRKGRRFLMYAARAVCTARSCSSEQRLERARSRSVFPTKVRRSRKTKSARSQRQHILRRILLDDMLAVAKSLAASEQRMERCAASGSVRSEPTEAVESPSCAFFRRKSAALASVLVPTSVSRCSLRRAAAKPRMAHRYRATCWATTKTRAPSVGPSSVMEVRRATSIVRASVPITVRAASPA